MSTDAVQEIVQGARGYEDVPERVFVSLSSDVPREARLEEGYEKARAAWRAIGGRTVPLARRYSQQTVHAFRTESRGCGRKRTLWRQTTECGQIADSGWVAGPGRLALTTCLSCRQIVRERYERRCEDDDPRWAELDEAYAQQQLEEMWRIQAAWHQPDPATIAWRLVE